MRHPKVVAEPREGSCIGAEGPEHAQPRAEAAEGASPADVATVLAAMAADAPVGATPVAPDGAVADSEGGVVNGAGCEPGEAMLALTVLAPAGAPPSAQERESQYKARIAAVLADSKLAGAGLALAPASQAAQLQPQALRTRHMAVRSKGVDALQGHAPPALWHSQARQPAASLATQQRQVAEQELLARSDAILRSLVRRRLRSGCGLLPAVVPPPPLAGRRRARFMVPTAGRSRGRGTPAAHDGCGGQAGALCGDGAARLAAAAGPVLAAAGGACDGAAGPAPRGRVPRRPPFRHWR